MFHPCQTYQALNLGWLIEKGTINCMIGKIDVTINGNNEFAP